MARVTITQDNLDKSKIIIPGKYICEVKTYSEDAAGDGSTLHVYELQVVEGKEKGVIMRYQVSEKAEGMGYEFWGACGLNTAVGATLDPAQCKGKRVGVHVQRGEYKGRPKNEPVAFFSVSSDVASAPVATAS